MSDCLACVRMKFRNFTLRCTRLLWDTITLAAHLFRRFRRVQTSANTFALYIASIHSEHLQAEMDSIEGKMNEIVKTVRVTLVVTRQTLPQLSLEFCEATILQSPDRTRRLSPSLPTRTLVTGYWDVLRLYSWLHVPVSRLDRQPIGPPQLA